MKTIWSSQAEREIDEIWDYIAADNPDAADRVVLAFHAALTMLGEHPKLGRPARRGGTRELVVAGTPYLLIYRAANDTVYVLHVLHGARDWPPKRKRP